MAGSSLKLLPGKRKLSPSSKKSPPLESKFQHHVIKVLKANNIFHFVKEAGSIRGIPDIVGCAKDGTIFMWELKRSKSEVYNRKGELSPKGRAVLQHHWMQKCIASGGIASFVFPENFEEQLRALLG